MMRSAYVWVILTEALIIPVFSLSWTANQKQGGLTEGAEDELRGYAKTH